MARLHRSYEKVCDSIQVRTAYRCRAYPDAEQQEVLNRTFGCVRVVWNRTLAERHARWHRERQGTTYAETDRALTAMKKEPGLAFLNEVSCVPLQQSLRHQHKAFSAFFAKRARYPRFKSRVGRQSAHYTRSAFTMRGGVLQLAKTAAPLRFIWTWPEIDVTALDPAMVIVSREPDGRWYVTFTADTDAPAMLPRTGHAVGVDLGVKVLHRTSTRLVREHDTIVIEDLNVAGMVRNRRLARAISDCGWGEFRRQLTYKCQRYGRELVVTGRWYPSSKTCSACGHLLAQLPLAARHWTCPSCRTRHDRDINAAKNILAAGLAVARGSPGDACGGDVRHSGSSRMQSPTKQEPRPARAGFLVLQGGEQSRW
jgi:putative transposase